MPCLIPYKVPQNNEGRFLQWTAINYFLETQTEPIELCASPEDACIYQFPDETESYQIPIQKDDVVQWIMNKNEITIDPGSILADIKIGIVQEGVLLFADIGTITEGTNQYFCTATIPCIEEEGCNYQFVIYDSAIVPPIEDCSLFNCSTVQDIIDTEYPVSKFYSCQVQDFQC